MSAMAEETTNVTQPQLTRHDSRLLDLAFAMDTTGSMGSYIRSACSNIRRIVEEIVAKEQSDLRLALVEYRDHPPQDSTYVTQVHDFTPSANTMKSWLEASSAAGGGDAPEAVADALHDVLKLSWREESTKICVLVSDAPPHGLSASGDSFPDGCPSGHDPMDLARKLAEKGVTLYVAGCEPALVPYKDFFAALAYITGGQYVPLSAASALTNVIVGGAQEELSLEQWMEQVNQLVAEEVQVRGQQNVSHDDLSRHVMTKFRAAGVQSKQLTRNKGGLGHVTEEVRAMSDCPDMTSMRAQFKPKAAPASAAAPASFGAMGRGGCGGAPMMKRSEISARALPERGFAAPPPLPPAPSAAVEDVYETGEGEIQMEQASRMVQKALMRNKIQISKK